jgi:hypothetical protein
MLKGYKTFIVNGVSLLVMIIIYFFPEATGNLPTSEEIGAVVDQADKLISDGGLLTVALTNIANMFLRAITTTSIFQSA